ncbi:MAG: transcriptional regulator [Ferruginibacter sp.]|nr:transcriptional regulator [Ferruginibacter sp.]
MEYKVLDSLLLGQVRLTIMSLLMRQREADFVFLKGETQTSGGNLSVQLNKLKKAGYIELKKSFKVNYPQTVCKLTAKGEVAFNKFVEDLQWYIKA